MTVSSRGRYFPRARARRSSNQLVITVIAGRSALLTPTQMIVRNFWPSGEMSDAHPSRPLPRHWWCRAPVRDEGNLRPVGRQRQVLPAAGRRLTRVNPATGA